MTDSIGASNALGSSSSYSAAINSAVSNQGSSTSTSTSSSSTSSTTSTSTDAITSTQEKELKNLGLNNDPSITTAADAKKAISKAQKAAVEKTTEVSGNTQGAKVDDIKDTVDISKRAQNAFSAEATE